MLKPRDRWIGWGSAGREAHLDRVIGLLRFLVRPGLSCRNLASRILGLCLGRIAGDYVERHGLTLLLIETFVRPAYGARSVCARRTGPMSV